MWKETVVAYFKVQGTEKTTKDLSHDSMSVDTYVSRNVA